MPVWNKKYETMPRAELQDLQLIRLKLLVDRVYQNVPHYRAAFDKMGVKSADINKIEDIQKLPFTIKSDLRDNYPYGLFATPIDDVVRIHASSGTTGRPTVVGYTKNDIDLWSELMARTFSAAGITKKDIIQNAFGYGLFTGGLGAHYGAETIGASVIPMSGGNSKRQLMLLNDFGANAICCTPSYAASLIEVAKEEGVDLKKLPVRVGVFGAEPWSNELRQEIEDKWGIKANDVYGLSELIGPGVSFECLEAQDGLHVNEDHFIVEVINPDTGEVLPYGEEGELVFTTLTKEAIPLIRYRTRDISVLTAEPCACGRTHVRMRKVSGRTDDMLIIRGVNVFPSQIEAVLMDIERVLPYYQIIVSKDGALDKVEVQVEIDAETFFSDEIKNLQKLEQEVERGIKSNVGISTKVRLVEPKSIARSEGKAVRVIDKRPKN